MHKIDTAYAVTDKPTPTSVGTPGYFSEGNTATGVKATALSRDWCNAVQEELSNIAAANGDDLDKTKNNQAITAIMALIASAVSELAPLASPTFTGAPKSSTPVTGDSSTRIATTAFITALLGLGAEYSFGDGTVGSQNSITCPSWLLGGLTVKFGISAAHSQNDGAFTTTFTKAFPNNCLWGGPIALLNSAAGISTNYDSTSQGVSFDVNGVTMLVQAINDASISKTFPLLWIAIGY